MHPHCINNWVKKAEPLSYEQSEFILFEALLNHLETDNASWEPCRAGVLKRWFRLWALESSRFGCKSGLCLLALSIYMNLTK